MSLSPALEKHPLNFRLYASFGWDRHRGGSASDSPGGCCGSFALDLKSGLGSSIGPLLTYKPEVRIDHRAGEILGHKVGRIIGSLNLSHLQLMKILLLLYPQGANVDVTEFAGTFAVRNGQCGGGIGVYDAVTVDSEVTHCTPDPHQLGRALHQCNEFGLRGTKGHVVLGPGPTLYKVTSDHNHTSAGGFAGDSAPNPAV